MLSNMGGEGIMWCRMDDDLLALCGRAARRLWLTYSNKKQIGVEVCVRYPS